MKRLQEAEVFRRPGQRLHPSGKRRQELEEVLLSADMGVPTVTWLMEELKTKVSESPGIDKGEIVKLLKESSTAHINSVTLFWDKKLF